MRGPFTKKLLVLIVPAGALIAMVPAYSKNANERTTGVAHVRQLTFDTAGPDQVINEFAVASPDGKYFVIQHSDDPKLIHQNDGGTKLDFKETSNWDIFRYNVDGTGKLQLTSDPNSEDQPTWSPDSKTIAYRRYQNKTFNLYLMDADGKNKRGLVVDKFDERTPAWSRDGKHIVFYSNRDGIKWNLYQIEVATGKIERLSHEHFEDKHPQYTPDGHIVFHADRDSEHITLVGGEPFDFMNLYSLDPATGAIAKLTSSDNITSPYGMRDNRHAWISPDGKYVAYHSNVIEKSRKHADRFEVKHRDLVITTIDGSRRVYLTAGDYRNFKHPSWSADGKTLFFVFKEKGKAWNAGSMDVTDALERLN